MDKESNDFVKGDLMAAHSKIVPTDHRVGGMAQTTQVIRNAVAPPPAAGR